MEDVNILIVDDEPTNILSISQLLIDRYMIRVAKTGKQAIQLSQSTPQPSLILLDVIMPELDGYQVLEQLKKNPKTEHIPVIFVTSQESDEDEEKGLRLGAVDYITKPIRPAILRARIENHLLLKEASNFLLHKNTFLKSEVEKRVHENTISQQITIRALAHLAEIRDPETGQHILRTQHYVELLAKALGEQDKYKKILTPVTIDIITQSAPLHDIGKVGIPDNILLKPGPLNEDEKAIMNSHTNMGVNALEQAELDVSEGVPFLIYAKEIARWHHEHWDGTGYPDGLSGENIPLSARLMAVADVFDALISKRPYKEAFSFEDAFEFICSAKGVKFDPNIIDVFVEHFDEIIEIAKKFKE